MPMRFADPDGTVDRRLPSRDADDRRIRPVVSRRRSTRCSTTRPARSATTASSRRTCTPTTRRATAADAIIASAQAHNVPVVSAKQMLDWLDGRNNASFGSITYNNHVLQFTCRRRQPQAHGIQAMLPMTANNGATLGLDHDRQRDSSVLDEDREGHHVRRLRRIPSGNYTATYGGGDNTAPARRCWCRRTAGRSGDRHAGRVGEQQCGCTRWNSTRRDPGSK